MLWKRKNLQKTPAIAGLAALYEASAAARYGLSAGEFEQILHRVMAARRPGGDPSDTSFFQNLHLKELALARACAKGNEIAWNDFVSSYRPILVNAARKLCRNAAEADEIAGSLYAELFGLKEREGERISLFDSYLGTGSLAGWLRMILAQREVDRWRKRKRLVAWEDEKIEPVDAGASDAVTDGLQPVSVLQEAVAAALRQLPRESRLLLALYYLDERTLAEIGKVLHVHESTVSRRLNRLLQETRDHVLAELRRQGLDGPAAEEALLTDVRRLTVDVSQVLASLGRPRKREESLLPDRLWRAVGSRSRQTLGDPT